MTPLGRAFVEDHKKLTKGLRRLLRAVKGNEPRETLLAAQDLDAAAGPHIQFEEEYLYPHVREVRGDEMTRQLYDEHQTGQTALKTALQGDGKQPLDAELQARVLGQLETAMDHVIACGTLLSHVTTLDASRQEELLGKLLQLRKEGRRWSELPPHDV